MLLAAGAVAILGLPGRAGPVAPIAPPVGAAPTTAPVSAGSDEIGLVEADMTGLNAGIETASVSPRAAIDTDGWTSGVVRGDIPLTASVVGQIQTIAIVIDELKSLRSGGERPWHKVVPVRLPEDGRTPTFEVRDIPFSDYGYTVRVHSPGLNGGQSTVAITRQTPVADSLILPITPGAPYSLRFQDQDFAPIGFTEVRLLPQGEPLGRPSFQLTTDNYGTAVFDNVLAGDYQVLIGPVGQPLLTPPPVVTVQPGVAMHVAGAVQPQGQVLTVPRGTPLTVRIVTWGQPLAGVRVRAQNTDRAQQLEVTGETDARGEVHFPNLIDGTWQIDTFKADYQHCTRQRTISRDKPAPEPVEIDMHRLR